MTMRGNEPDESWRDEMIRRTNIDNKMSAGFVALHRSLIDFALTAIRGGLLLNGGGAVAVLSFMAASAKVRTVGLLDGLTMFVIGAVLSAVTASLSYISQSYYTNEIDDLWSLELNYDPSRAKAAKRKRDIGDFFRFAGCFAIASAYLAFILGCIFTYYALKSITISVG